MFITRPARTFPDRLRLPFRFDPELLARDLASLSAQPWTRHFVKQNYDGEWSVIPLRSPAGETHPIRMISPDPGATSFVDTPLLAGCPCFRDVMATFRMPLRSVRLMRLMPGSVIKEHRDPGLSIEDGTVRLHVPVTTSGNVAFFVNRTRVVMDAGSCWYLRLSDPHRVENSGTAARVHLVIDAVVNDWITEVFDRAVRQGSTA